MDSGCLEGADRLIEIIPIAKTPFGTLITDRVIPPGKSLSPNLGNLLDFFPNIGMTNVIKAGNKIGKYVKDKTIITSLGTVL